MSRRNLAMPDLSYKHPGYFKIVLSLILVHAALAIDSLQIPENSVGFRVMEDVLGGQFWILAALHLLSLLFILIGLYARNFFFILRFGCALSAVVFNFMAAGFTAAALLYGTSYFGAITCVALSLSSIATAKEPEEGPRSVT